MLDPVTVVVVINTTKAAAFDAFVAQIGDWWPIKSFSLAEGKVSMDAKLGGKIVEKAADGTEHVWGAITRFDVPNHISISWSVGKEATATDITVDFEDTDDGRTGVTLVHTGWEALGDEAATKRENYRMGWERILDESYAKFARATCPPPTPKATNV